MVVVTCLKPPKARTHSINLTSLPNNKFLYLTKLKAFADGKSTVLKIMISHQDRTENIVVTSIFSFSHNVFKRFLSWGRPKLGLYGKQLTHSHTMTPFDAHGKQAC